MKIIGVIGLSSGLEVFAGRAGRLDGRGRGSAAVGETISHPRQPQ
jgi:hypothetical protein